MVQSRHTLQDHLRQRQQNGFTGRQELVARFEDNLALAPGDPGRTFVFNVHGDAGVGKTFLSWRLRQVARGSGCATAYIDENVRDPVSAMLAVAGDLKKDGAPLSDFENRMAQYRRRVQEVVADPGAPEGIASFLTKTVVTIGVAAARDIPVAGSLLAPLDAKTVADQADQARKYLAQKFSDHADVQLLTSPEDELTPSFVSGLCTASAGRPAVLFIDTYERTGLLLDDWLRRLYVGRYGDLPESLVVTIAGRMPLDQGLWRDYLPVISDIRLVPFTEPEARLFLAGKEITDDSTVKVILSLSGRLPLWLATLADAKPENPADVGDPAGDVVQQFLVWEEPQRRAAAVAAAFPRILNQDILSAASPEGDAGELFAWLCGLPFVSRNGMYWEYHDVVRNAMLRLHRAQAPAESQAAHAALADAYERWAANIESSADETWSSPRWVDYTREAIYHRLCTAPAANLFKALQSAAQVAERNRPRLGDWAQLLTDAGRDAGDPTLTRYGEHLRSLLQASPGDLEEYLARPQSALGGSAKTTGSPADPQHYHKPEDSTAKVTRPALLREPRTPERPSTSRQDRQIVLLGPPQSGKTTFLSALNIAFLRRKHDWNFAPADERSADHLIKLSTALTARQEFPEATRLIQPLNWVLNGWAPGSERRFFRRRETKIPVQIGLDMIDVPGETLHSSAIGTRAQSLLIDEIARSDAIIFLFDPIRESDPIPRVSG